MEIKMRSLDGINLNGKKVLLRPDINSPIDPQTGAIVSDDRIVKTIPVIRELIDGGAAVAIIAHQGDTLDYQNLTDLSAHAARIEALLGQPVEYLDDVCGPAAIARVKALQPGEIVILGNLRYLTEEVSTFEKDVRLTAGQYGKTRLVRRLAPLFDLYVNDAFSAAHRNAASMVAFQELLPTAAGPLLFREYGELFNVLHNAVKPVVFVLGGAKISDAFGMMKPVLENGTADTILTTGVTGIVFLAAAGIPIGEKETNFLRDKDLLGFIDEAKNYLLDYPEKFALPLDLAFEKDGLRAETDAADLPGDALFLDIGPKTVAFYANVLAGARTIFANGPAGLYEDERFAAGTRGIWEAIAASEGHSVIGGGDTVSSASKFIDLSRITYVSTAGGAMVRFMSGKKLPLIMAMEKAFAAGK